MPRRKIILLLAAAIIAGGTMLAVRSMMMTPQPAATMPRESANEVLGAARDLPMGTLIKDADLKWIPWVAEAQNVNLFAKGSADKSALIGSVVRHGVHTDDPILADQVVNPHAQGFLAAVLQPGMRAMAISVDPGGDVAGFVFPGDHVDVILSHTVSRRDDPQLVDRHMSETVLVNVRVLALDQKSDDQANDPKIAQLATLEVTPREAERLALSAKLGSLSLTLRSLEVENTPSIPPTPDQVTAAALALPAAESHTWDSDISQAFPMPGGSDNLLQRVQIMRGKDKTETTFERPR